MEFIHRLSTGIKSGHQITKQCETCTNTFIGWSDDTVTIKGPMPPNKLCNNCNKMEQEKMYPMIEESLKKAFDNMKK